MFADRARVHLRAGDGGAGVVSFARMRGKPRGKPQGGNGGAGGDVVLRADPGVATLLRYDRRPHHRAGDGTHGSGDLRHGKRGADLVLPVPLGTVVMEQDGTVLADLVEARLEDDQANAAGGADVVDGGAAAGLRLRQCLCRPDAAAWCLNGIRRG